MGQEKYEERHARYKGVRLVENELIEDKVCSVIQDSLAAAGPMESSKIEKLVTAEGFNLDRNKINYILYCHFSNITYGQLKLQCGTTYYGKNSLTRLWYFQLPGKQLSLQEIDTRLMRTESSGWKTYPEKK